MKDQTPTPPVVILLSTPHYLVVNKPAGLIVERSPFEHPTVEDLVWAYLKGMVKHPFLGIVHQLDRVTSGMLLLARKKSALKKLNVQFAERTVRKTYLALVEGALTEQEGRLEHWLEKDQPGKRALIRSAAGENTRKAVLTYRVVRAFPGRTLVEIELQTGRFHQIRAQFGAIGHPVVGDEKYGARTPFRPQAIALHASRLVFTDPVSGEEVTVEAPVPEEWEVG